MSAVSIGVAVYVFGVILVGVMAGFFGFNDDDAVLAAMMAFLWPATLPVSVIIMVFMGFLRLGRSLGGHE